VVRQLLNSCRFRLAEEYLHEKLFRDSDASAPAEYPPDQPEADGLDDDGTAYGAEEAELEAALVKELADVEREVTAFDEDQEMGGIENTTSARNGELTKDDDDEESEAGSEDLEAESSGSDEEDLEEDEGGEGDGDEDVEMGDDGDQKGDDSAGNKQADPTTQPQPQQQSEVMVH
jgi:histone chaperone ASF1